MRLFVDTSALFALNDRRDRHHAAASRFVESLRSEPVSFSTTDYIVDETVTLLRFKISHREALAFLRFTSRSRRLSCEQVTADHLKRAEEIFSRYRDKLWSFTECVSFAFHGRPWPRGRLCFRFKFLPIRSATPSLCASCCR